MPSTLSWVDYSESDRRKMSQLVDLFREQDTRDELGIGGIRDAFADMLFPGTSTIQTRAKYMLFIPWLCKKLEAKSVPSGEATAKLEINEVKLIKALASSNETGIIGIDAKEKLQRFSSEIYWAGLKCWGILNVPGSRDNYVKSLDSFYQRRRTLKSGDEYGYEEEKSISNWDQRLPEIAEGLPEIASFELSRKEADYLKHRIEISCHDSLLAAIVENHCPVHDLEYPWQFPERNKLSSSLREKLEHAEVFSLVIHGGFLLYNILLADKAEKTEKGDKHRSSFQDWVSEMDQQRERLRKWDFEQFVTTIRSKNSRIAPRTWDFVRRWVVLVRSTQNLNSLLENHDAIQLITIREKNLKGHKRARLHDQGALERWNGASGTSRLNYRWGQVKTILTDINNGLQGKA